MKFVFIDQHAKHLPVRLMCRMLAVSAAGYYAWRDRRKGPIAQRQLRRTLLVEQIRQVHERSHGVYGSPRVHRQLRRQGVSCCENTVAGLMQQHQIRSKIKRRFRVRTTDSDHHHPLAPNTLNRQFAQRRCDQVWAADITAIWTDQGWLFLFAIIDLCSRRIVGWCAADHLRASAAVEALRMALAQRRPIGRLLHHSDRGMQYACGDYRRLLQEHGLERSMSRSGNCYDNAVMESFFKTLKVELVHHEHYLTHQQARLSLHQYIEIFYNRQRLHSALDYQSPCSYENRLA
jgi:transposase InsO family protein